MLMGPRARMVGLAAMLPPGIERTNKPSAPHPRRCPLLEVKRTWSGLRNMSAYDPKPTFGREVRCHAKYGRTRYSPLVRRNEADRIIGAASTTTGSIVSQETSHDSSQ